MYTVIRNADIFTGDEMLKGYSLLIRGKYIAGFVKEVEIPAGSTIIDGKGYLLCAGFIDLQIYGGGGYLFSNDPNAESLNAICDALLKEGTTSFLLTLATNSNEIYHRAFEAARSCTNPALAGLHLEGPYFNPVKRGAHIESLIRTPSVTEVQTYIDAAAGTLRMMTIAPEMVSDEVIQLLLDNNVILSAGHSNAGFEQAIYGFRKGISTVTHLFNAMSSLHHRDTGLPGAAFLSGVYASIIADGVHVDWQTLSISKKMMGPRLFLITDAVQENLTGAYIHIRKNDRYTLPDGTLSGSCLTMPDAMRNCVQFAGIEPQEALRMATVYPAEVIRAHDIGKIAPGYLANLVLLDKDFSVKTVFLQGILQ